MVFDDGLKTYIQMADGMKAGEAPALFIKDDGQVNLVNYRVKDNYYVVDRIFNQAELRNGVKETVVITRNGKASK
jgi:type IV secretion system protein VirB9